MVRALFRSWQGRLATVLVLGLAAVAVLAPVLLKEQAQGLDVTQANKGPSMDHYLGTDRLGRDILARILVASRPSLSLALTATALGATAGYVVGTAAALLPARPRSLALRLIDALQAFPGLIVAIMAAVVIGPGRTAAVAGVGLALSFSLARVASTLALGISGRDYVIAGRVLGLRRSRLLFRYVVPNVAETVVITTTVAIGTSIVSLSSLSFLGLGIQPPEYDWGRMLTEGVQSFYLTPAAALAPAVAIAVSSIAFGFAGEAIARATNPLLWVDRSRTAGEARADAPALADTSVPADASVPVADASVPAGNGSTPESASASAPAPALPPAEAADSVLATQDAAEPAAVALLVEDLTVTFDGVRVVDGVSFSLERGETVGLVGESGSGKTMTALAISQLVPYPGEVGGRIVVDGQVLDRLSAKRLRRVLGTEMAMVFQDPMSSLNPALKVGRQLTEGVERLSGASHKSALARARGRLRDVGMPAPATQLKRYPHELSGGMRQRVMIAMGLMHDPALVIADEPTTALDVTIQAQLMSLFGEINRDYGMALVLITHNVALVGQNCQRMMVMYAGRIVEDGPTRELMAEPRHPYTRALLAAVPTLEVTRDQPLATIPGSAPEPARLPAGCAFYDRCPDAVERCRAEIPALVELSVGRRAACWVAQESAGATVGGTAAGTAGAPPGERAEATAGEDAG